MSRRRLRRMSRSATPALSRYDLASPSSARNVAAKSAASMSARWMRRERAISKASGLISRPSADITPAPTGKMTRGILSLRAIASACSGPAAAERHHAARAIVEAALGGVDAEGAGHVLADDVVDAPGRAQRLEAERLGDAVADGRLGGGAVERHGAAEEEAGIEIAEHEVGVRQRRLGAAAAIAGGPRIGAGAARADAQEAAVVDLGDAAAAGADLDHVDGRDADGEAAALPELVHARHFHAVALDRARRRAPAHPWRSCRPCRTRAGWAGRGCGRDRRSSGRRRPGRTRARAPGSAARCRRSACRRSRS